MKNQTPGKAVRKYCLWCMSGSFEVKVCPSDDCVLWKYRCGKGRIKLKTIRQKCKDCDGEGLQSIKNCQFDGKRDELCPLWPYRLGKKDKSFLAAFHRANPPRKKGLVPKGLLRYQKEQLAQKNGSAAEQKP